MSNVDMKPHTAVRIIAATLSDVKPTERFVFSFDDLSVGRIYTMVQYVERNFEEFAVITNSNGYTFEAAVPAHKMVGILLPEDAE